MGKRNNELEDFAAEQLNFAAADLSHKLQDVDGVITVGIETLDQTAASRSNVERQLVVVIDSRCMEELPRRYRGCDVAIRRAPAVARRPTRGPAHRTVRNDYNAGSGYPLPVEA